MQNELKAAKAEIAKGKEWIDKLVLNNENANKTNKALMVDVKSAQDKVVKTQEQLKLNISEKEKLNKKIKDQASEYDKKIEKLNADLLKAQKGKKGKDNSGPLKQLEAEIADLKSKLSKLESDFKAMKEERDDLKNKLFKL